MSELKNKKLLATRAYVNGQWIDGDAGAKFPVLNPATGDVIAEIADLGGAETTRAVEAAAIAFESWKRTTAKERAGLMRTWYNLIMETRKTWHA